MKRITLLLTILLAALVLTACAPSQPVVQVMLRPAGEETGAPVYETVYSNGKTRTAEAFSPDAQQFSAAYGDFSCNIMDGKVINTLVATTLTNSTGEEVEADTDQKALMLAIADEVDHDIWALSLFTAGERKFAYVQLNVNWSSPGILYEYDNSQNRLTELAQWDSLDLAGLSTKTETSAK